jgi:hypothetical protein
MLIVSPDCDPSTSLLGEPWSVRLAGATSACPAIELYESGELVDVISATSVAAPLLRGARLAAAGSGPRAIAWGRLPGAGRWPEVGFGRPWRRDPQSATLIVPASWCWVAIADGRLGSVTVRSAAGSARRRLARGVPCC